MVRAGHPSGGCAVCRRRKIKCDEKKPGCSYCIKTKQKCPGYASKFDLAWRDQTEVARKHVDQRMRVSERARPRECSLGQILSAEPRTRILSDLEISNSKLVPAPKSLDDPEPFALGFFFTVYASSSTNALDTREYLDFLEPPYSRAKPHSTLSLSTAALANCLYIAWKSQRPDAAPSRSSYLRAVSAMKEQLTDAETCSNNEILISVLLLQQYETLVNTAKRKSPARTHLDGALALIKHRGLHKFTDKVSQGLLSCVRAQMTDEALRTCQPPKDSLDISEFIAAGADVSPDIQIDNVNVDVAVFYASFTRDFGSEESNVDSQQSKIGKLLYEGSKIEKRLSEWHANVPASWRPVRVSGRSCISASIQQAGLYQHHCHIYPSLPVSKTWNKYRLAQIRIHLGIVNLLCHPSLLTNANDISTHRSRIQQEVDDICACIPYHLGNRNAPSVIGDKRVDYPHLAGMSTPLPHYLHASAIGGYQLLHVLTALESLNLPLREGQREWISGQLMRVCRIYNIGRQ